MQDSVISKLIKQEALRQKKEINLIASENLVSKDVLAALGSVFTNKYAEGYPGARYYEGQVNTDQLERLAQDRALKLFKLSSKKWSVNVQALSGSPANLAVYLALVPPGKKIMGMSLSHGGHLTHGHGVSATGKLWKQVAYGVDVTTGLLDYDAVEQQAIKEKPAIIVAGYTAYARSIDWKRFRTIADTVGALLLMDVSHTAGLIAGGVFPSPFSYADVVMMTTHKTLRGPRGALLFSRIDDRSLLDKINKAVFPGLQGGPHMHTIAAIAVALKEAATPQFKAYAKQVVKNAKQLAKELQKAGLSIVTGGTDTHLFLVDTWKHGIGGREAAQRLAKEGVIVNMNTIPGDTRSPKDPSGIRIGVALETTKGKKEKDMQNIAKKIARILLRN